MRKSFRRVYIRDPITWPESIDTNVDWKLLLACTLRHIPITREALAQGANVNCRRSDYLTPLHIAVQHDDSELIQLLCDHRLINIEAKTLHGLTPLHKAALLGHRRSIEKLIENGAKVNCLDSLGKCPLHYSAARDDIGSAAVLLINGAHVNVYDVFNESPLYTSVIRRRSIPMIRLLLCYGGGIPSVCDQMSLGLFLEAILSTRNAHDMEIVDLLYRNGADLNAADFIGLRTPLHIAAMTGNLRLTAYLIEKGADLSRKNKGGYTPLDVARICRNHKIVKLLQTALDTSLILYKRRSMLNIIND